MTTQANNTPTALAGELAKAFDEVEYIHRYAVCCGKYPRWAIEKAFKDAQSFPRERIKKSRAAIFFYLVKQYARKTSNNSRH